MKIKVPRRLVQSLRQSAGTLLRHGAHREITRDAPVRRTKLVARFNAEMDRHLAHSVLRGRAAWTLAGRGFA
jgi:hypothetical protein